MPVRIVDSAALLGTRDKFRCNPPARKALRMLSKDLALAAAAALAAFAIVLFAPQVLNDGDTYLHIAAGDWILQHRTVPATDPFSYTFSGAPWIAHEWLSEALMALAYGAGGWDGLLLLFGCTTALAFFFFARHLQRWLPPLPAAAVLVLGGACAAGSLLARPHLLVLPIVEAWAAGLLIARERDRVPWALLPLMTIWANLHGSFIFGIALACPFALEAAAASGGAWTRTAQKWGGFLLCAVLAALLTPHGWHGLIFPFQLVSLSSLDGITEWRSADFSRLSPFEMALLAAIYVSLSRGVRAPMLRLLVLLGLLHLALHHARHQMLFGIVGALIFAEPLARALGSRAETSRAVGRAWAAVPACMLAAALALTVLRFSDPAARPDSPVSPGAAFAHVPPELAAEPVLNDYSFGGYLIFRGVRPFVDSRAEVYRDRFLADYSDLMRPNPARLAETVRRHGIRWMMLAAHSPAAEAVEAMPGWQRLYGDDIAVVFSRAGTR